MKSSIEVHFYLYITGLKTQDQNLCLHAISAEVQRIRSEEPSLYEDKRLLKTYLNGFSRGIWQAYSDINEISVFESVAYNKRASADPDHWSIIHMLDSFSYL